MDIRNYHGEVLPTDYWYFSTYIPASDGNDNLLTKSWPTAIGAPNNRGVFKWEIKGTRGFHAVGIVAAAGPLVSEITKTDDPRIQIRTKGFSNVKNDVILKLTYTTPDARKTATCEKPLTIRTFELKLQKGASYLRYPGNGWSTYRNMDLVDNVDRSLVPAQVNINEKFTDSASMTEGGDDWAVPNVSPFEERCRVWQDWVYMPSGTYNPGPYNSWIGPVVPDNPEQIDSEPPTNSQEANTPVDRVTQTWRFGSKIPGAGETPEKGAVNMQRNRGFAVHSN